MNPPAEGLHPLWALAYERSDNGERSESVYRVADNCYLTITTNGDLLSVRAETEREIVPFMREVFTLEPSGDFELNVTADVKSVIFAPWQPRLIAHKEHWKQADLTQKNGLSRLNPIKYRLDSLVKLLSDSRIVRVNPWNRTEVIEGENIIAKS